MEFSILGPLAVRVDGVDVAPTAAKPRALLVRLLVAAGRPVPPDRLIEDLWDGTPPRSGAQTLQTYVLQLRKAIGAERLVTDNAGYRLVVHEGEVDAVTFEDGVAAGRRALDRGAPFDAIDAFEQALRLWRGAPLADAGGAVWAQGEAARLEELHLVARELLLEAKLAAGHPAEVIAAAEAAVAEHPLRERLWAHLITALYRQGRQADALRAFQRLRALLADELGIDPSPELRDLERAVLDQDARLAAAPATARREQSASQTDLPSGLVTFLLTDVAGSTRLWDTVPQLMADALALHDAAIRTAVEGHGGIVLKARGEGDSAFAVFRRATDAAAAAVAAQRALASSDWPEGCALSVRMAVHTGEALERDGDYYGPTVNRAARLRAVADGGQIVVSHATADVIVDHLGPELHVVEVGRQQLRDLERPELIYLLVDGDAPTAPRDASPSSESSPVEPPALPGALLPSGPFVGRDEEIERLTAEWDHARQGTPRVVMVGGEPGVGKTRLAAEMAGRAHAQGAIVLYGRCDEDLGVPYQPFAESVRLLLSALDAARLRAVRGVEELVRLVPELADIVPDIRVPTHSDPDTERYALFDTVARLLVLVSRERPILLVLDDLHWAAKPTLLMLRHILRFGEGAAVELLGTYRTTDLDPAHPLAGLLADLHREGTVERVVLGGLDESDVHAFLEATGREDEDLAHALSSVTSGNPFFLIEVLRHVDESGGSWNPNTLPQGVREAVGRRLARLTEETRDALLAGAVAGPRFSLDVIEKVLDRDLVDAVGDACDAGILREESGGYFHFSHALVRQSLLTGVASVKRVRLHQRVAETLEAAGADRDEYLADLAHHYFESAWAGNAAKAVEYCRRAANQALDRLAYEGAAELFDRVLQALEIEELPDRAELRAELLLARCEALLAAGDAAGAGAAVGDLEAVAGGSQRLSAWVACFSAELAGLTRPDQLDAMERRVAVAADEFAALGDTAGEAVAHNTRAACLARLGRFAECELELDRALTAARSSAAAAKTPAAADHRRVNAVLAGAPVAALWGPNSVARAGGRCLDVIRLLRITTGSPAVEATSIRCQAMLEAFRGRTPAARRLLDTARRSLAEVGLRHALLEVDLYAGIVELLAEDVPAATTHLRRAYDGLHRMGLEADASQAAALLARACLALGQTEEADALCAASERFGGQDLRASIAWRTVRAQLLSGQGEHERAREVADAAVALAEPTDALIDQGDAHLALAVVLDAAGERDAAVDAAEAAIDRYERKGASALAARARRFLGMPAGSSDGPAQRAATPNWLVSQTLRAFNRAFAELWAAGRWDGIDEVVAPGIRFENRRRLALQEGLSGSSDYRDLMRGVLEIGWRATRQLVLATRGERLVLLRNDELLFPDAPVASSDDVLRVLEFGADGRLLADIVFDVDDIDDAYGELDGRYVASVGAGQAQVFLAIARAVDAYNRRDSSRAPLSPDVEALDHRSTSVGPEGGRALWSGFEVAITDMPDSTLHLAAVHALDASGAVATTVQRGTTEDDITVEVVFHGVHLVEAGSITHVEIFPENELDAAMVRFHELGHVTVVPVPENLASRVLAELYAAWMRRDWPAADAVVADEFVSDNRVWRSQLRGRDALRESTQAFFEFGEPRLESSPLATRGEHLALVRLEVRGPADSAGSPEVELLEVVVADEAGRLSTIVVFEPDELDAAFAELDARDVAAGRPATFVADNTAAVANARYHAACARRDWTAAETFLAEDVVADDRGQLRWHGRAEVIVAQRGAADIWMVKYDCTTIATRGDRLALMRVRGSGPDRGPNAPVLEVLDVVELNRAGEIVTIRVFEVDEIDTAFAELDARYLAGDGAPYVDTVRLVLHGVAAQARDWERTIAVYAGDMTFVDHRPVAFGVIEGPTVGDVIPRRWTDEARAVEIEAVDDGVAVVLVHAWDRSREGAEVGWPFHVLCTADDGLLTRMELFDADDRSGALAGFEEVRRARKKLPVAENLAAAAHSGSIAAALRGDWHAAEQFYDEAVVGLDRRAGIRTGTEGPEASIAAFRFGIEMGVTRYDTTTIATRGERIALRHMWCGSGRPGSPVVELLNVIETNAAGLIETTVGFDVEDLDAAFADLDARYAAGEAAAFADTWAAIVDAYDRFNTGRGDVPPHARPMSAELKWFDGVPGIEARVIAVHRIGDGGALLTARASAPGTDPWEWLVVFLASGGRMAGVETYDVADFQGACARFEELMASG